MQNNSDISHQLDDYSDLFDIYIEKGEIPEEYIDDPLAIYIGKQVEFYRDCLGDEDMKEALRQNLLDFFRIILPEILEIQEKYRQELTMIESFFSVSIETKRQQWAKVKSWLSFNFSAKDFNIEGYAKLFGNGEKNNEQIFDAIEQNWKESAEQKKKRLQENLLFGYGNNDHKPIGISKSDYEKRKEVQQTTLHYPALQEIIKLMGREQETNHKERDTTITQAIPILLRHSKSRLETDGVILGDHLSNLLPMEYALIEEPVFYKKFVNRELQQFSSKPPSINKQKKKKTQTPEPRLKKGPIILAIDTSGSMSGRSMKLSKALLMQITSIARKQKRKCFLISFSVRTKCLEISRYSQFGKVDEFLSKHFTGGTDGEQMFAGAIKALNMDNYSMADVLIISDFIFHPPKESTAKKIKEEQAKGTRFYGLCIGGRMGKHKEYIDKYWEI